MILKANMDAGVELRSKLKKWNIINFDSIQAGPSNKVYVPIILNINNSKKQRNMTCYRTNNRGFRFWIEKLSSSIDDNTFLQFSLNDKSELLVTADPSISLSHGQLWSDEELELCVKEYLNYRDSNERKNKTKSSIYLKLATSGVTKGRSIKAIEYRFLNISSVLESMGEEIITGLLPKSNVGENVKNRLIIIIENLL